MWIPFRPHAGRRFPRRAHRARALGDEDTWRHALLQRLLAAERRQAEFLYWTLPRGG